MWWVSGHNVAHVDFPRKDRPARRHYTHAILETHGSIERARYTAPDTTNWLYPAPLIAYHLGSISAEPWKNLPVRFGTINFHFAWLPRTVLIVTAPMDLYETKFRNLYCDVRARARLCG